MCVCVRVKYDYYKSDIIFSSRMGSGPLCNVLYKKQKEPLHQESQISERRQHTDTDRQTGEEQGEKNEGW